MNKKGFTLVELLAVIVILGIVGVIATVSMISVANNSNKELLESKENIIIEGAKLYGQDNRVLIMSSENTSITVTVGKLILDGYIEANDDCDGSVCLKNDVTDENMENYKVTIFIENNRVYAEFEESKLYG